MKPCPKLCQTISLNYIKKCNYYYFLLNSHILCLSIYIYIYELMLMITLSFRFNRSRIFFCHSSKIIILNAQNLDRNDIKTIRYMCKQLK